MPADDSSMKETTASLSYHSKDTSGNQSSNVNTSGNQSSNVNESSLDYVSFFFGLSTILGLFCFLLENELFPLISKIHNFHPLFTKLIGSLFLKFDILCYIYIRLMTLVYLKSLICYYVVLFCS